ncbi:MAG: TetR family transcriptional regulator [Streptosporangiales bacterium]|nr:TetR family transcriptional regulator [Streptosporangiales bacterium]
MDHRKRPRRRGAALNEAIFAAVFAEIEDHGYPRLTMERVAERARASKASLYRRWPTRVQLVMDAVYHHLRPQRHAFDTGSLRGDLLMALRSAAEMLAGPLGEAFQGVLSEVLRDKEQAAVVRGWSRGSGVRTMREITDRAAERGEVDSRALTPRRLEVGQALLRHHFLFHGPDIADDVIVDIVDDVLLPLFRGRAVERGTGGSHP